MPHVPLRDLSGPVGDRSAGRFLRWLRQPTVFGPAPRWLFLAGVLYWSILIGSMVYLWFGGSP